MKKSFIISVFLIGIIATMGFTQDTSVNVNEFTIPELSTVPEIDGDLSDAAWANVPAIPMDQDGDSPAGVAGSGDLDIVLKVAWDDETNALYFGINVIDDVLVATRGMGSSAGDAGWNNERLEIIMDGANTGDPASSTTSGWHQQYTFDMPNTWDDWDASNDLDNHVFMDGGVGYFNTAGGGIAVSADFVRVPVFERIEGTLGLGAAHAPWNISDSFLESAVQIRATDPNAAEWIEASVEYNWEIKLVPFEYLEGASNLGYDLDDPANISTGYQDFWEMEDHVVVDLEANKVIGFTAQQNDADEWSDAPAREHQTNTTGISGNWNSSESLSALILGPKAASVSDWSLQ